MKRVSAHTFLEKLPDVPLLDVRSPAEYEEGHIPEAVSFPLFNNQERAIIGTLYKQQGRTKAIKKGLEIVGPKMVGFVEEAEKLNSTQLALYCWRGGMRSESMAWLLERCGIETYVLEGGYKAYRKILGDFFDQKLPLHVLTGYTGSKKTQLLHLLREKGEQVVDLEGLARHQGSSFGNQKSKSQPTTEHFQNLLFEEFRKLDLLRPIWIEDESMRIGRVMLVEALYQQKNRSPHFVVEVQKEQRVDFLVTDYGKLQPEQLITATEAIRKKLGGDKSAEAIEHIRSGQLEQAAAITLNYYDARYRQSLERKQQFIKARLTVDLNNLEAAVQQLQEAVHHAV